MAPDTSHYRGYEIIPRREWSYWTVSVHPIRPGLPLLPRSRLKSLTACRSEAVVEAKKSVDRLLARLDDSFA
jgi:hypothetical protein